MEPSIELPQVEDYRSLFLGDTALLDVRAPVEFEQGAFPFTTNLPLMNDKERQEIGIRYKDMGQDEAIKLGHKLVSGEIKNQRVTGWEDFFKNNPNAVLYCFRGGMRSKITQQWIYEKTGLIYPRVKGGYKAMRRFLLEELEKSVAIIEPVILSGRTGIGKTVFLEKIKAKIDLEGIFHHRGSVFGKHVDPQPAQIDIENNLSIQLMKLLDNDYKKILFEDESSNIGSRRLPQNLIDRMQISPVIVLEAGVDERIEITFQEYIVEALDEFQSFYSLQGRNPGYGFEQWVKQLRDSMSRIKKRLGGLRHTEISNMLEGAIEQHTQGNIDKHKDWIRYLLVNYYDPMYDYQLEKKRERVIFKGSNEEVTRFLAENSGIT